MSAGVMKNDQDCKHEWTFDYQEFYDGNRPGYLLDVFHCKFCLERNRIEVDGKFHHIKR